MLWLEQKYTTFLAPQLPLFRQTRRGVYNFRCPYCGDSQQNKTKARGYLYPKKGKLLYRCHNCGKGTTFSGFLRHVDEGLYKEFALEKFKEGRASRPVKQPEPSLKFNYTKPEDTRHDVLKKLSRVSECDPESAVVKYVEGRLLPEWSKSDLYFAENMAIFRTLLPEYKDTRFDNHPRLILPFINADGVLTHLQGRAINDVPKSERYVTLEIVEDTPKVYGLNRVDPSKPIKVVEVPIDSHFLTNCCAMGGSDLDSTLFDPANTVFIFDNEPRNREIVRRMESASGAGFGVCVWGSDMPFNDINNMVLGGMTPEDIDAYIDSHTFRGLKAKMAITAFKV